MRAANVHFKTTPNRILAGCLGILLCLLASQPVCSGANSVITNVSVVNVTPASFSVVWSAAGAATSSIAVFADALGATSLDGVVGVEPFPLHTGAPAGTNAYQRRLSEAALRQRTASQGLEDVRVSDCTPGTTYYYQLRATDLLGQTVVWPAAGLLPSVTTAQENSFVLQSRQIVINLPGLDPSGSVVILSNSNTPSLLAGVAGDGAPGNQVYFSVCDLLAAGGATNYLPLGNQQFTATVLGNSSNNISQTYTLNFTTAFSVAGEGQFTFGNYAVLNIGSAVMRAGGSAIIPIGLYASGITNLSCVLTLTTNRFSSVAVQAISSQLHSATLQPVSSNSIKLTFTSRPGQTLLGNQELAQLNLTAISNQPSAFLYIAPLTLQGLNSDGSSVTNFAVQPGRLVIVGKEPLLEALPPDDAGLGGLELYGIPGRNYELQSSTNLAVAGDWTDLAPVTMTNLSETITGLDVSQTLTFYRAYDLDPGSLLVRRGSGGVPAPSPAVAGATLNYAVGYSTNVSGVVTWHPRLTYTLTDSYQPVKNRSATNNVISDPARRP